MVRKKDTQLFLFVGQLDCGIPSRSALQTGMQHNDTHSNVARQCVCVNKVAGSEPSRNSRGCYAVGEGGRERERAECCWIHDLPLTHIGLVNPDVGRRP